MYENVCVCMHVYMYLIDMPEHSCNVLVYSNWTALLCSQCHNVARAPTKCSFMLTSVAELSRIHKAMRKAVRQSVCSFRLLLPLHQSCCAAATTTQHPTMKSWRRVWTSTCWYVCVWNILQWTWLYVSVEMNLSFALVTLRSTYACVFLALKPKTVCCQLAAGWLATVASYRFDSTRYLSTFPRRRRRPIFPALCTVLGSWQNAAKQI